MGDPAQEPLSTGGKKLPECLLAQEAGQASVLFQNTHLSLLFVVVFCWFDCLRGGTEPWGGGACSPLSHTPPSMQQPC